LEGSVDGIKSREAQRRKFTGYIKDGFSITDYGTLKMTSENRKAWKLLIDNVWLP